MAPRITETYSEYHKFKSEEQSLLMLTFFTVSDYLYLLMETSKIVSCLGPAAMFYLAAAVSDFYLPENQVSEHKIQSDDGTLTMKLEPVPKLIYFITTIWAPRAFIVTFKLETDPDLLLSKSLAALKNYNHQVVVANMLKERKKEVTIVQAEGQTTRLQVYNPAGEEIEEAIVDHLVQLHQNFS